MFVYFIHAVMSGARKRSTTYPLNEEYITRRRGSLSVRSNRLGSPTESRNVQRDVIAESYHVGLSRLPSEAGIMEHEKDYANPPPPEEKGEVVVLIRGNHYYGDKIPSNLHRGATNDEVRRGSDPLKRRQLAIDTRRRGSLPLHDSNSFSVSRGLGSLIGIRSVDEEDETFQDKLQQVRHRSFE